MAKFSRSSRDSGHMRKFTDVVRGTGALTTVCRTQLVSEWQISSRSRRAVNSGGVAISVHGQWSDAPVVQQRRLPSVKPCSQFLVKGLVRPLSCNDSPQVSRHAEDRGLDGAVSIEVSAVAVLRQCFRVMVISRIQTPVKQTVRKTRRIQGCSILVGRAMSVSSGVTQLVGCVTTVSCVHNELLDDAFVSQRRCAAFTESPDLQRCNIFKPCH